VTGIRLCAKISTENGNEAGDVTKDDRGDVEVSKDGVNEANLLYFRPDDVYHSEEEVE
jgi:hypothetical protein